MNSSNSCVYHLRFSIKNNLQMTTLNYTASTVNYTSFIVCPTVLLDFLAVHGGIQMTTVGILCHSQPERKSLWSSPLSVMFNTRFWRYPLKFRLTKLLFSQCRKSSSKREVHSYKGLPQETRKIPD